MQKNKFGELIYDENSLCELIMQGHEPWNMSGFTVDPAMNIEQMATMLDDPGQLLTWTFPHGADVAVPEFDLACQNKWFMPQEYRDIDIAKHVLDLCDTQEQLQRAGEELLLFQERGLFNLLRYLKYLVDVMRQNHVIWGVGRGSSVASYVLYLLGVHRIDSMYYELDPREFLR